MQNRADYKMRYRRIICLSITVVSLFTSPVGYAAKYSVTVLEKLAGGTFTQAFGISNSGEVVGQGDDIYVYNGASGSERSAVVWKGTEPINVARGGFLDFIDASAPYATSLNSAGKGVGSFGSKNGAFCFFTNGQPCNFLYSSQYSEASGINESGQIVGSAPPPDDPDAAFRAILWQDSSAPGKILGIGFASGINSAGAIVGTSYNSDLSAHAKLWNGVTTKELGTLGGKNSAALAINDHGRVVGWADTNHGVQHAALWHRGIVEDLGTLGGPKSSAAAINVHGDVVGMSQHVGCCASHAVLWQHETDEPLDLNLEIDEKSARAITLVSAVGINDQGDIAVNGYDRLTYAAVSVVLRLTSPPSCANQQ